jgi:hypothetical protein
MHMDRAIFDLRASMEATSLYILLSSLLDQGQVPSLENARAKWNGTEEELLNAVDELMQRRVLEEIYPIPEKESLNINPSTRWQLIH